MLTSRPHQHGMSLIELMVVVALLGILLSMGANSFSEWRQNSQVRNAADAFQNGLNLARTSAITRNTPARFQLMTSVGSDCALSSTGNNWVVSLDDASASCNASASETVSPRIIQTRTNAEGSQNVSVSAGAINTITFDSLGRANAAASIDFSNPAAGTCAASGGKVRCMRVTVSTGGQVRMCDPARTSSSDPQAC